MGRFRFFFSIGAFKLNSLLGTIQNFKLGYISGLQKIFLVPLERTYETFPSGSTTQQLSQKLNFVLFYIEE